MSLLYLGFVMGSLPFIIPAFSLWLCLWFISEELFFSMEVPCFFLQESLVQGEPCVTKQKAGALFAFHSSSSLWGQIPLSDESNTIGMAVHQPDGEETSVNTSVECIFMPTAGCFSPPGMPQNNSPTDRASTAAGCMSLSQPASCPDLLVLEFPRCHGLSVNCSEFWSQACTKSRWPLVSSCLWAELELLLIHPKHQRWPNLLAWKLLKHETIFPSTGFLRNLKSLFPWTQINLSDCLWDFFC